MITSDRRTRTCHLELTQRELAMLGDGVAILSPDSSSGRVLRDLLESRLGDALPASREELESLWRRLGSTRLRTVKRAARRLGLIWPAWLTAAEVVALAGEVERMRELHRQLMKKMQQPGYKPWKPKGERNVQVNVQVESPTLI